MNKEIKEIALPEGWEVDRVEDGKIILKAENKLNSWKECIEYLQGKESLEYVDNCSSVTVVNSRRTIDSEADRNTLPGECGEALLALSQLLICRNAWWEKYDCKPKDSDCGYSIMLALEGCKFYCGYPRTGLFNFSSSEIRDKFYKTFKDLFDELIQIV